MLRWGEINTKVNFETTFFSGEVENKEMGRGPDLINNSNGFPGSSFFASDLRKGHKMWFFGSETFFHQHFGNVDVAELLFIGSLLEAVYLWVEAESNMHGEIMPRYAGESSRR